MWSVRGDHLWFGFFPYLFLFVLVQAVVAADWKRWSGMPWIHPASGYSHSPPLLLGHCQAKPSYPSDFLKSHGISNAGRDSQLKMKKGWWQGVFPSNCQACHRGLKKKIAVLTWGNSLTHKRIDEQWQCHANTQPTPFLLIHFCLCTDRSSWKLPSLLISLQSILEVYTLYCGTVSRCSMTCIGWLQKRDDNTVPESINLGLSYTVTCFSDWEVCLSQLSVQCPLQNISKNVLSESQILMSEAYMRWCKNISLYINGNSELHLGNFPWV